MTTAPCMWNFVSDFHVLLVVTLHPFFLICFVFFRGLDIVLSGAANCWQRRQGYPCTTLPCLVMLFFDSPQLSPILWVNCTLQGQVLKTVTFLTQTFEDLIAAILGRLITEAVEKRREITGCSFWNLSELIHGPTHERAGKVRGSFNLNLFCLMDPIK